ncbi:hypothetical protein BaRGS_00007036 [Batillaria attramentaria]|uniref:Uncharacterized protein n=1 Tax=Batillaria attramentaria TaxID=370345 RepID=A0ABD0LPY1_9CAEN
MDGTYLHLHPSSCSEAPGTPLVGVHCCPLPPLVSIFVFLLGVRQMGGPFLAARGMDKRQFPSVYGDKLFPRRARLFTLHPLSPLLKRRRVLNRPDTLPRAREATPVDRLQNCRRQERSFRFAVNGRFDKYDNLHYKKIWVKETRKRDREGRKTF